VKFNALIKYLSAGVFSVALNAVAAAEAEPLTAPAASSTGIGWAIFRMVGALCIVFAVFFAGVWLLKNGQRFLAKRGGVTAKLRVIEAKSLGARQTIYVVAYEKQRMLIASSPSGVNFLSALPTVEEEPVVAEAPASPFSEILRKVITSR